MPEFIIIKATRDPGPHAQGYAGPACGRAGVIPGRVYFTRKTAEDDAVLLAKANPVGFRVVERENG